MAYTVDEVSERLDVPRPTLYRYLREYSIAHHRRAGRIYIPEESFERIKEVRELHEEGLGTESVRRRLLEGETDPLDVEGLKERLDRISEALEGLREGPKEGPEEEPRPTTIETLPTARAVQTILARQSLLIWAVFNLTEMLEDLLVANGRRRRTISGDADGAEGQRSHGEPGGSPGSADSSTATDEPTVEILPASAPHTAPMRRGRRFGVLAQRRRRGALVVLLLALLAGAALLATGTADERSQERPQERLRAVPSQEEPREESAASPEDTTRSSSDEATVEEPEPAPQGPAAYEQPPAVYDGGTYDGGYIPEQPPYQAPPQTQDAAPVQPLPPNGPFVEGY